MTPEKFSASERFATDINTQIAWLAGEMDYSRDKVKGYEEKLVRLSRDPSHATSVFGFMSGYWHRFRQADALVAEFNDQSIVGRALQADAKVVAGLSDKVAFSLWLAAKTQETPHEPEWLLDTSLQMVKERAQELSGTFTDEKLLAFNDQPFENNPMGQAILGLHAAYQQDPYDVEVLRAIAVDGSAAGVLMWQAYARDLEQKGFRPAMPKPGLSSGNIEPWR